jgi:hypothetical protein
MVIDIHELAGREDTLAGCADGAMVLSKLIEAAARVEETEVIALDFFKVEIATASFLREAVLGFRDYCRNSRPNLYPVVARANLTIVEELEGLLRLKGDAIVVCEMNSRGIKSARVLGKLEDKQSVTLRAVLAARGADAATLAKRHPEEKAKPTAWHNRLTSLSAKGILMETQSGRTKIYRPVVEVLVHGH